MKVFGLEITRTKQLPASLANVPTRGLFGSGGWWPLIREPFAGAWQRNISINVQDVLTYSTVFACISMIASDVAKLFVKLIERDGNGIWTETENSAYSPVLRKPNHFSTRIKFYEYWQISKLTHGNTYALKSRDVRGVVDALYVLDPTRTRPLVSDEGFVYYQLGSDVLAGVTENSLVVPASEMIHDIEVPLYHPLVGVSPIHACGLAAIQGLRIQNNSTNLFTSGSQLSGILTAPGEISEETAQRLAAQWNTEYMGEQNAGKVAVVGDGLTFKPMVMSAVDAQLVDQLKWTAEQVCSCFHVPGYMVGIGPPPPYTDIQSINLQYYTQALQNRIENLELLLDEGLGLASNLGIEFDIKGLARMDTKTQMDINVAGVGAGIFAPNEARADFDRKPLPGGDTVYMQQQNWPLQQLASRPTPTNPTPAAAPSPEPSPKALLGAYRKHLELAA